MTKDEIGSATAQLLFERFGAAWCVAAIVRMSLPQAGPVRSISIAGC